MSRDNIVRFPSNRPSPLAVEPQERRNNIIILPIIRIEGRSGPRTRRRRMAKRKVK